MLNAHSLLSVSSVVSNDNDKINLYRDNNDGDRSDHSIPTLTGGGWMDLTTRIFVINCVKYFSDALSVTGYRALLPPPQNKIEMYLLLVTVRRIIIDLSYFEILYCNF